MPHPPDSELILSAWCPDWLDGSGVAKVTEFLVREPPNWKIVETLSIPTGVADEMFDSVRYCGHAVTHTDGQLHHPGLIPVACELTRLRNGKKGPRLQCIVEHALSHVDCPLGLHAIDLRHPVPEGAFDASPGGRPNECARDVLSALRQLWDGLQPTWAACLTHGRGPSIADRFKERKSYSSFAVVYLSRGVSPRFVTQLGEKVPTIESANGFELILSPIFGAPMGLDWTETVPLVFSALRQASLPFVPREELSRLDKH